MPHAGCVSSDWLRNPRRPEVPTSRALRLIATHPATLFGVFSFILLVLSARGTVDAFGLWRIFIIPAYVIHLSIVMIAVQLFGVTGEPPPVWFWVFMFPLRFAPFMLVDYLFERACRDSVDVARS